MAATPENANNRLNGYVDKALFATLSLIIGLQQMQAMDIKSDHKELEGRVLYLYTNTVSKSELKDTEERITKNVEAIRSDIKGLLQMYVGDMVRNQKR